VVIEIKDHGRMALLRFTDATGEEWVSLADVSEASEGLPPEARGRGHKAT